MLLLAAAGCCLLLLLLLLMLLLLLLLQVDTNATQDECLRVSKGLIDFVALARKKAATASRVAKSRQAHVIISIGISVSNNCYFYEYYC